ncbi:uncharacterized protein LOC132623082 [Lycium barbarum]|uniref:uncharacterized protein LOC132623082 n=1 Tax=Lycium barbarum TaxID=112863 RepID=UPI00293E7BBB|nr:uncharacterized protein LOC132623082 [Lycium barbarum]
MAKHKTKDALLKNRPNRIPRDQWSGLVSYWFSDKARRRTQANRNNRTKQKMPHTGGSKSIATLMDEKAENGIEPTRAQILILTHKERKDGRSLDEDSARTIDMINERISNGERSTTILLIVLLGKAMCIPRCWEMKRVGMFVVWDLVQLLLCYGVVDLP